MKQNEGLAEVKAQLNDLKSELEKIEEITLKYSSEADWNKRKARHWLHGATETNEVLKLEEWLFECIPPTHASQLKATRAVAAWKKWLENKGSAGAYYVDFKDFKVCRPKNDETLFAFITRLAFLTEEHGKGKPLSWRALKSFLDFLRDFYPQEEIAFIEHIFPQKMDIKAGTIIRTVPNEKHAISQEMASEILLELSHVCLNGRPNAHHAAAECLGLCWLCLTSSRLRLSVTVE